MEPTYGASGGGVGSGGRPTYAAPQPRSEADVPVVVVAGFWRRLIAALADAVVALPIAFLLAVATGKVVGFALPHAPRAGFDFWLDLALAGDPSLWGGLIVIATVLVLYTFLFQATLGRTLGMRLLGLRVIDVYGERPGPVRSLVRTAGYLLCVATFSLGFVWIAFDREKRGLHDWLAGTYVVKAGSS